MMGDGQLSLFDIIEDKHQRQTFTPPEMWTIRQLCDKYYQFKQTDGCSCSFLNSAKRHLRYFTNQLEKYGFDPDVERLSDINSVILSDYRQMLAENTKISTTTANVYIAHVRILFFWAENMHGLTRPTMGTIR